MENNKNKKSVKLQGVMLNFYDFIQAFVFTTNHHLNLICLDIFEYFTNVQRQYMPEITCYIISEL